MIIVDSSVWIDYFNNRDTEKARQLDSLLSRQVLLLGDLIVCEILQGFRSDSDFRAVKTVLDRFRIAQMGGYDLAVTSAQNYRRLRKAGITPRKTIDVIIATFCIEKKHQLLHSDKDFDVMQEHLGLIVV